MSLIESAGDGKVRIYLDGAEAAASGSRASAVIPLNEAMRLADKIVKYNEMSRRLAALAAASRVAGDTP